MQVKFKSTYWCSCGNASWPHSGIRKPELHQQERFKSFEVQDIKFCCSEMKEAFDEKFICAGEFEYSGLNKNTDVNILCCSAYPECVSWTEMKINICPFCGEKIKVTK